ncbi:MAG TPA: RHS repeat protein [Candidatus Omnitrophota bacterium]|nr:RHS repeat protein [Candidatus Omnitrophota bacterium]HQO59058.1 RHS repeat protein [Candidatus Omnitrophota bacterium]HQP12333.1 RHS repeat protein [Candidatus Omnitrophota bacterium]
MQYGYDAFGNRSQVIYPSGKILDYTYDAINRLTDIEQNSVSLAHFDYDVLPS